ncbi:nucleotide exchange factor GrpE [Candidatus Cardinium hertigii]|jgi:molecular chaperone GrpE|uniref:Protein GrpE n=1 Tax=Candidatus Cardinium hertigii TaxID=247481 RepID=A0A3N2QB21_9BACT|nr:nucleotide exchange factor GrpE [Candidatus Cardinium hertigii]ROT47006.1 nucleotide exchange factor GrpE [Candidatus Cardinium hertigii]
MHILTLGKEAMNIFTIFNNKNISNLFFNMKLQDKNMQGTSCNKEQEIINPTPTATGCCGSQKTKNRPCCCGAQEAQNATCCCESANEEASYQSPNGESPNGECKQINKAIDKAINGEDHAVDALEKLQALLVAANEKYIRLYSEFENFKKRVAKERIELIDKANEKTLKELMPIVDDFERGIAALQPEQEGAQHAMQEGIKLIYDKLCAFLKKFGVKEMALQEGSAFNTELHEAIMQKPVENPAMKGKIIAVVEQGYMLNAHVLRFAKVVIGV